MDKMDDENEKKEEDVREKEEEIGKGKVYEPKSKVTKRQEGKWKEAV